MTNRRTTRRRTSSETQREVKKVSKNIELKVILPVNSSERFIFSKSSGKIRFVNQYKSPGGGWRDRGDPIYLTLSQLKETVGLLEKQVGIKE